MNIHIFLQRLRRFCKLTACILLFTLSTAVTLTVFVACTLTIKWIWRNVKLLRVDHDTLFAGVFVFICLASACLYIKRDDVQLTSQPVMSTDIDNSQNEIFHEANHDIISPNSTLALDATSLVNNPRMSEPISPVTPRNQMPDLSFRLNEPSNSRAVTAPQFWRDSPTSYFLNLESIFQEHNVFSEIAKYNILVRAITDDQNTRSKVADVLMSIHTTEPYTNLKRELLKRFTLLNDRKIFHLLRTSARNGSSCVDYLVQMRTVLGAEFHNSQHADVIDSVLRHKLLQSLDPSLRFHLEKDAEKPLLDLALDADRMLAIMNDNVQSNDSAPLRPPSKQVIVNQMLESRLNALTERLNHSNIASVSSDSTTLSKWRSIDQPTSTVSPAHTPPEPAAKQRGKSYSNQNHTTQESDKSTTCHYHMRYGPKAKLCKGGKCMWYTQFKTGSDTKLQENVNLPAVPSPALKQ